jgi:ATP-dependent DNA helicase DinG
VDLTQGLEAAARTVRLALADCGIAAGARIAVERISGAPALAATLEESALRMSALVKALQANSGRDPELDLIVPRASELRGAVIDWLECLTALPAQGTGAGNAPAGGGDRADRADRANGAGDGAAGADEVRWIAATAHGAQFHATPLVPGAAFARARERHTQAWILTSATLTVAGCFDPFIAEIGLAATVTRRWGSPFDFGRQARLYLPRPAPSPLLADFPERVADCAWPLLAAAGGRAFILCSTLRAVERVAARLRSLMARHALDLLLLEQGAGTRSALLDDFRHRRNAVLVGSVSFWEGIDVRGAALALVVIDKIPFAPPDDPVVGARIRRLRALGRNPFNEYQLPEAITMLRQGAGRLIRGEDDRGVLMIADERILTKPYGRVILDSLPPFARAVDAADACKFLQHVNADDLGKSRAG